VSAEDQAQEEQPAPEDDGDSTSEPYFGSDAFVRIRIDEQRLSHSELSIQTLQEQLHQVLQFLIVAGDTSPLAPDMTMEAVDFVEREAASHFRVARLSYNPILEIVAAVGFAGAGVFRLYRKYQDARRDKARTNAYVAAQKVDEEAARLERDVILQHRSELAAARSKAVDDFLIGPELILRDAEIEVSAGPFPPSGPHSGDDSLTHA
jgi:hypothetical protein